MQIIKRGVLPSEMKFRGECSNCGCQIECHSHELKGGHCVECPTCDARIFMVVVSDKEKQPMWPVPFVPYRWQRNLCVTFCLLLFAVADVSAQWGSSSSGPVGSQSVERWVTIGDGYQYLFIDGVQRGAKKDGVFWPYDATTRTWTENIVFDPEEAPRPKGDCCCGNKCGPCRCGRDCPEDCVRGCGCVWCKKKPEAVGEIEQNFGVDRSKCCPDDREMYRVNGVECDKNRAYEALKGDSRLPDDSAMRRVVAVGSEAKLKEVRMDWDAGKLAAFRDKAILHCYSPDHWHMSEVGYKAYADPSIYIVDASGKVLHRQDHYDGPDKLASALRKTDPGYDPAKDPDLTKPAPGPDGKTFPFSNWLLVGLVAVAGYLLFVRKK